MTDFAQFSLCALGKLRSARRLHSRQGEVYVQGRNELDGGRDVASSAWSTLYVEHASADPASEIDGDQGPNIVKVRSVRRIVQLEGLLDGVLLLLDLCSYMDNFPSVKSAMCLDVFNNWGQGVDP